MANKVRTSRSWLFHTFDIHILKVQMLPCDYENLISSVELDEYGNEKYKQSEQSYLQASVAGLIKR